MTTSKERTSITKFMSASTSSIRDKESFVWMPVSKPVGATGPQVRSLLSHAYELVVPAWKNATGSKKRDLFTIKTNLETVIFAFVEAQLSTRTGQIKRLSEELTSVTDEIGEIKKTIDSLKQAAKIAGDLLKTLTALAAVM